jgi:hypothetical protein
VSYIEWREENKDVKPILLYYLELFIEKFDKPCFFTKGNVSSARKILEWAKKYQFNPYFFVYLNFVTKSKDMERMGFRFMSSIPYLNNFISLIEKRQDKLYNVKRPLYDIVKGEMTLNKLDINNLDIQEMINLLSLNKLSTNTFLYLTLLKNIKNIIKPSKVEVKIRKLLVIIDRGCLPNTPDLLYFENYEDYCYGTTESIIFKKNNCSST